jgi:hypothetical protein
MTKANNSTPVLILLALLWWLLAAAVVLYQVVSPPEIQIEWVTATEYNTAGFNLYRSETPDGEFRQINEKLIPGSDDPALGGQYLFLDREVHRGQRYYYVLEDVEYDNTRQRHAPITGQAPSLAGWSLLLAAFSGMVGLILFVSSFRNGRVRPNK